MQHTEGFVLERAVVIEVIIYNKKKAQKSYEGPATVNP